MAGRTITFCGFMGCGKSTVGRIVARRLPLPFKDTNDVIEYLEEMSIDKIVKQKGEEYFRTLENQVVLSTSEGERVMAVGEGGFNETTIAVLKTMGPTIYLDLSFEEAKRRMKMSGKKKEVLENENLFGLFIKRRSLYTRAHFRIWTESLSVDEVVESALRLI